MHTLFGGRLRRPFVFTEFHCLKTKFPYLNIYVYGYFFLIVSSNVVGLKERNKLLTVIYGKREK